MNNEDVRSNLRAALNAVIVREKGRLNSLYDAADDEQKARVEMLSPVLGVLRELQQETAGHEGVYFLMAPAGHSAIVSVKNPISSTSVTISTNYGYVKGGHKVAGNTHFTVEVNSFNCFVGGVTESQHYQFDEPEEVLGVVVDMLGRHRAQLEVLKERQRRH